MTRRRASRRSTCGAMGLDDATSRSAVASATALEADTRAVAGATALLDDYLILPRACHPHPVRDDAPLDRPFDHSVVPHDAVAHVAADRAPRADDRAGRPAGGGLVHERVP